MNEIKESTAVPGIGGMSENLQEFDQFPAQFLSADGSEDVNSLSDKMKSNVAVSARENNGDDDFTDKVSEKDVESSMVEEVISNGISTELFSDVNSSVSHDPNFMANQNQELKNRELQKWIQSVERSSAFGENWEQTMQENWHTSVPISKRDHEKGIAIETQTDWEWVMCAVANQSLQDDDDEEEGEEGKEKELGEENFSSSEDERPLSFNSTKSSDLISCFAPSGVPEAFSPPCLPNVAPPKILQYCRESEKDNVTPQENKINFNPLKNTMGLCEFCQNPTKPLPTLEQESTLSPEELYCCEEYQKFLEMVLQSEMAETRLRLESQKSAKKNLKSVKNPPKGKTLNKKELKNKVKAREMRLKQKQETLQQQQSQLPPQGYHTTRQMNTINYQLSSRRCLEEGWTVRTPYLEKLDFEGDIFEVEPGKRMALWRGVENISEGPLEKFYDNGRKFFTIFADGTGNIFYPTGQLAILITATQPCHFTYVIYREASMKRQVAAIFEHTGYGTCYHANGNVRLYLDPSGGVEADEGGAIKRRWQWHQPSRHVHAPPLQPIHVALNTFIGIKIVSQRNIQLNFIAKRRSCKINMGVNVKPVNVMRQSAVTDENHFYLEDKKTNIECLLSKVRNLIQYSHSPKLERILPPIYLTNKASKLQQQAKQVSVTKKRPKVIVRSEISSSCL